MLLEAEPNISKTRCYLPRDVEYLECIAFLLFSISCVVIVTVVSAVVIRQSVVWQTDANNQYNLIDSLS